MFQRAYRDEDHVDSIFVSSASYCKQLGDAKHEFILVEVRDKKIPEISNFLVLDRTVQAASSGTFTALFTTFQTSGTAQDRLRVSCYGDKDLLIKQCSLGPYRELELLMFPLDSSKPLLLCELLILALETSNSGYMYNLMIAQCFWFASCVWECMQLLVPSALCTQVPASKSRGKFRSFYRCNVDKAEIQNILCKAEAEIRLFRVELTRLKEVTFRRLHYDRENAKYNWQVAGRDDIDQSVQIQSNEKEREKLKKELEMLEHGLMGDTLVPAVSFMSQTIGGGIRELMHSICFVRSIGD